MRAFLKLAFLLHLFSLSVFGQENTDSLRFLDGHLFRDHDTLACKVVYGRGYVIYKTVTVVYNNDTIDISADGPIKGFSFLLGSEQYYGIVNVRAGSSKKNIFLKKTLRGKIDLYDCTYTIYKSVRGVPGSTSEGPYTDYYIAKNDPLHPELAIPKALPSLTRKRLEPYLNDNPNIMNKIGNRLKSNELFDIIKEYNIESK